MITVNVFVICGKLSPITQPIWILAGHRGIVLVWDFYRHYVTEHEPKTKREPGELLPVWKLYRFCDLRDVLLLNFRLHLMLDHWAVNWLKLSAGGGWSHGHPKEGDNNCKQTIISSIFFISWGPFILESLAEHFSFLIFIRSLFFPFVCRSDLGVYREQSHALIFCSELLVEIWNNHKRKVQLHSLLFLLGMVIDLDERVLYVADSVSSILTFYLSDADCDYI